MAINTDSLEHLIDSLTSITNHINYSKKPDQDYLGIIITNLTTWQSILVIFGIIFIVWNKKQIGDFLSNYKFTSFGINGTKLEVKPNDSAIIEPENYVTQSFNPINDGNEIEKSEYEPNLRQVYNLLKDDKVKDADIMINDLIEKTNDVTEKMQFRFTGYYLKHITGDVSALGELETDLKGITDLQEKISGKYFLGNCYLFSKNYSNAKLEFEQALNFEGSLLHKYYLDLIIGISDCIKYLNSSEEQSIFLIEKIRGLEDNKSRFKLTEHLSKSSDNEFIKAIFAHLAITFEGNNTNQLFDAGYYLSQIKDHISSQSVYNDFLSYENNNTGVLNNLGVEYSNLNLDPLAIIQYKKSSDLNSSLASANLADRLIEGNFINMAEEILKKASQGDDVHENVYSGFEKIRFKKNGIDLRIKTLNKNATITRGVINNIANAIIQQEFQELKIKTGTKYFIAPNKNDVQINKNQNSYLFSWDNGILKYKIETEGVLFFGLAKLYNFININSQDSGKNGYFYFNNEMTIGKFYFFENETIEEIIIQT